jgi:hypothetical protein
LRAVTTTVFVPTNRGIEEILQLPDPLAVPLSPFEVLQVTTAELSAVPLMVSVLADVEIVDIAGDTIAIAGAAAPLGVGAAGAVGALGAL